MNGLFYGVFYGIISLPPDWFESPIGFIIFIVVSFVALVFASLLQNSRWFNFFVIIVGKAGVLILLLAFAPILYGYLCYKKVKNRILDRFEDRRRRRPKTWERDRGDE